MKTNQEKSGNMVKVPETGLLSLVASRLKGRALFPEKVEAAKALVKSIVLKHS